MATSGNPEEQDTIQDDSSASPRTPRQTSLTTRLAGAELAQASNIRASSPVKRPAATFEEDHEAKSKDAMDVDGQPAVIDDRNLRGDAQSDSNLASNTGPEATSISQQGVSTPTSNCGSTPQTATDRHREGLKVDEATTSPAPSLDEQVIRVHQMYNQLEEREGVKGYVLSGAWYKRIVAKTSEGQKSGEFSKADMEAEIGPVDNSDLVVDGK